ncbi:SigE family RNA polymerase sigma factor [Herbihabitans rhizosphaerae]|uniref:SigE family RNA polymerase sigma factor n=1 Tax=Herbihabitans rhizosphaerae TaxID=1872711 RepID=UPI001F5FEB8F|nr:SigE family RNA polymerase sigma factor [Herbihabitans rhizosphaerae]
MSTIGEAGRWTVRRDEQYSEYVSERLPTLRRTAYLLCGDSHRADDIVQAAITRLYLHWRKAQAADNLDAYVRRILVRTFLNEQRRAWISRVRLTGRPAETPTPPAPPGPDIETQELLRAALQRVSPRQRAALVLRFLCDLPVAEVAAQLGCSEGNVKSLTANGLTALRRQLGDRHPALAGGSES